MTNYNDGQWHRRSAEETKPTSVHDNSKLDYVWLDSKGSCGKSRSLAGLMNWKHVLAFRVAVEHREPREWWVGFDEFGALVSFSETEPKCLKTAELVRVIEKIE